MIEDYLQINPDSAFEVITAERLSAEANRPGLKLIRVKALDARGFLLRGVKVWFDTEPSEGIAYDHLNVWGVTDEMGNLVWDHLGKPTRYAMGIVGESGPLITCIRTDLGNEYFKPPGSMPWSGNVPVNRPGIYSYRIVIRRKG